MVPERREPPVWQSAVYDLRRYIPRQQSACSDFDRSPSGAERTKPDTPCGTSFGRFVRTDQFEIFYDVG